MSAITPALLPLLRDPRRALPAFGKVATQVAIDGQNVVPYRPETLTFRAQQDALQYWADPPRDEHTRMTRWLIQLKGRQAGISFTAEAAAYVRTSSASAWHHLCLADTPKRAQELLGRVNLLHDNWPTEVRFERRYNNEEWQANFAPVDIGGERLTQRRMLTQHIQQDPVGGAWDSLHWSEVDFCGEHAATYWSSLQPSLINRYHAQVHLESTANPGDQTGSVGYLKEVYFAAKNRRSGDDGSASPNRFLAKFYPFWDGKLNRRPWAPSWRPDLEELRLLEKYGRAGLALEHLAFRREVMATDFQIRRNPETFGVWYPFDDLTCWPTISGQVFTNTHLARNLNADHLVAWEPSGNAMFYPGRRMPAGRPDPDAGYVLAVDPNGYGGRDHGAAELREVWADSQREVASFAGGRREGVNPEVLADWITALCRRWRVAGARVPVVVESNGVGAAVIALLRGREGVDLYHTEWDRPGVPASQQRKQEALAAHLDALIEDLVLQDADKVEQHTTYRNDKAVEETDGQLQMQDGAPSRRRRPRHHWDKVSASMWASWAIASGIIRRPTFPIARPPRSRPWPSTPEEWDEYAARGSRQEYSEGTSHAEYENLP